MASIDVPTAVERLRQGEVVAIPTETVYGLAGRIDSDTALNKIFTTKKRPFFDPLIVHVHDVSQVQPLVLEWPPIYSILTKVFWPGPLTIIVPKTNVVSPLITSGLETVALRCPQHPIALEILRQIGVPLAAPSANRFGHTSPTCAADVEAEFSGQVPVVDGGPCMIGVESTVLQAEIEADESCRLSILRPGGISRAQIRSALQQEMPTLKFELLRSISKASPGHLAAHYQPESPLVILNKQNWSVEVKNRLEEKLQRPLKTQAQLLLPNSPQQAARTLYQQFRGLSRGPEHCIWITRDAMHESEDWEAIWDRIKRASTTQF